MDKTSIYFLCTGNSCRSQMAEGFAKKYLGNNYEVLSAGIEARGIHPLAIKVMNEKGIDISDQTSDVVNVKSLNKADIVITLCKDAMERCPISLPRSSHYHWPFDDPAKVQGTEDHIIRNFRKVRDEIESTIQKFITGNSGVIFNSKANKYDHLILKEDFGEQIKHLRESKGLNITGLAIRSGLSEDYLIKTEKNLTNPSRFFMHHLANAFQMDFDELINHLYTNNSSKVI